MNQQLYEDLKRDLLFTDSAPAIRAILSRTIKAVKAGEVTRRQAILFHSSILKRREFIARSICRQGRK